MMLLMMKTVQSIDYESDFALWLGETVANLKSQNFQQVDWENLIEEVESLGKSQRSAVRSYLVLLLEHLLKRCYGSILDCNRGWEIEIRNFRQRLMFELEDSPSLKNFIVEILPKCYGIALDNVKDSYPNVIFPDDCPFPNQVEILLNDRFWEKESSL